MIPCVDPYKEDVPLDAEALSNMGGATTALRMWDRPQEALQMEGYLLDQYTRKFRYVSTMGLLMGTEFSHVSKFHKCKN